MSTVARIGLRTDSSASPCMTGPPLPLRRARRHSLVVGEPLLPLDDDALTGPHSGLHLDAALPALPQCDGAPDGAPAIHDEDDGTGRRGHHRLLGDLQNPGA